MIINYRASNNETCRFTLDFSNYAGLLAAGAVIRAQGRQPRNVSGAADFEWCSNGQSAGQVAINPATGQAVFTATCAQVTAMPQAMTYDIRLEMPNGDAEVVGCGCIDLRQGVTLTSAALAGNGSSGIGDTWINPANRGETVMVLPTSLSSAVAEAQGSAVLAALAPASLGLLLASLSASWGDTPPAASGAPWVNGGLVSVTSGAPPVVAMPAPLTLSLFGAAMLVAATNMPESNPGAGQWWNDGGVLCVAAASANLSTALAQLLALAPFNLGAIFSAWFATLPTAASPSGPTLWNDGGLLSFS